MVYEQACNLFDNGAFSSSKSLYWLCNGCFVPYSSHIRSMLVIHFLFVYGDIYFNFLIGSLFLCKSLAGFREGFSMSLHGIICSLSAQNAASCRFGSKCGSKCTCWNIGLYWWIDFLIIIQLGGYKQMMVFRLKSKLLLG